LAASVLAEGKNLLPNGEFEEVGANNIPASWKGSGGGTVSVDKEIKYAGEYSLKVALEKQGAVYASSSPFPVKPGKLYLITLWYKADGFGGKKNAYRGAGAYSEIYFKGADGKDLPRHKTAINEGGSPFLWSLPFPYADSEWAIGTLIVKSPDEATSAYFKISLSSRNSKVLPVIRLDNIWIREYKAPAAKGKVYTYEAEKMNRLPAFSKIVVDKEAENGTAVASVVGKQKKGAMVFGPYTKDQAAGQYKVIYRLKIADNTKDIPAFTIKIFSSGFVNKPRNSKRPTNTRNLRLR